MVRWIMTSACYGKDLLWMVDDTSGIEERYFLERRKDSGGWQSRPEQPSSVLALDLWNAYSDRLLRMEILEILKGSCLVGYADVVAKFIAVPTFDQAQIMLNRVMRFVKH